MKRNRIFCMALAVMLALGTGCCPALAEAAEPLPEQLILRAGETRAFTLPFAGYWESDTPEVAEGRGNSIMAYAEGYAVLALESEAGDVWMVEVEVRAEEDVPAMIRNAIDIGIAEWREVGEQRLSQKKRDNKYIKWWGYEDIGWCGAFVGYCLDTAGVPMLSEDDHNKKSVAGQVEGGIPYSVRAAGVPKIYTGFNNMGRISDIPRPGYLVIYGARDYYAYVHVGLITDVIDRGDGVYQLFTVEGNVTGGTVKRYSFLYDRNAGHETNLSPLPESEWTEPETYHYDEVRQTKHDGRYYGWYIHAFCQTWQ